MKLYRIGVTLISLSIISSCTTMGTGRHIDKTKLRADAIARTKNIKSNDTVYTKSLQCYGTVINQYIKLGKKPKVIKTISFAVNDIFDKTGKVYPATSTALSDMVLHAVAKMNLVNVYDYESSTIRSRVNYVASTYPNHKSWKKKPLVLREIPVGVLKPSAYTISGALTQFDERENKRFNIDIDVIGYNNKFKTTDVAIDLRLVNSSRGLIVLPTDTSKSISVSLTNRLITASHDGDYFKLINGDDYGLSYFHEINDPKYYALREIVELGVLRLFSDLFQEDWNKYCSIRETKQNNVMSN